MHDEDQEDLNTPLALGRAFWAIQSDVLPQLYAAQRSRQALAHALSADTLPAKAPKAARRTQVTGGSSGVAVIPLTGLITPRGSWLDMLFGGGGGLQAFRTSFREALGHPDVGAIVLDIDSPGGLSSLVQETAQEVYDARGEKPIIAVSNTMCASAAYFIASQADEMVVTPSGMVGSIGVYMLHVDWSAFNEAMGVDPTYVYAGEHKVDGNPDEPLSDEVKADWQQEVDEIYTSFIDAVARGRGVTADQVRAGYGQGRTLLADRALAEGLVDRIDTIEAVVGGLLVPGGGASAGRASKLTALTPVPGAEPEAPTPAPAIDAAARAEHALSRAERELAQA